MDLVKLPFKFLISHRKYITELEYILEILPKCQHDGPWIAGGSLLRTYTEQPIDENSDIDVFFQNENQLNSYVNTIVGGGYKGSEEDRKTNQYVVTESVRNKWHTTIVINYMKRIWKIQCVSFVFFKDVSELFDSFDFDLCMLAYDGNELHAAKSTIDSINSKKGKLLKVNYASVTLKRLVKYMRRGYDFDDADVAVLAKSFLTAKNEAFDIFGGNSGESARLTKESSSYCNLSPGAQPAQSTVAQPSTIITSSYYSIMPPMAPPYKTRSMSGSYSITPPPNSNGSYVFPKSSVDDKKDSLNSMLSTIVY